MCAGTRRFLQYFSVGFDRFITNDGAWNSSMNGKKPAVVERKEVSLDVSVPLVGYNCIMPFNVFKIEPVENGKIMHFGYLQGSSVLNQFSCFISTEDITRNSKNVRSYFERLPQPQLVDMPTVLMKPKETVTIARYLNLSRVGTIAAVGWPL